MEGFKEYFTTLFSVCSVCALCDLLSDFTSKGVSSALKIICSLAVMFTVFSAIFGGCDIKSSLDALEKETEAVAISENYVKSEFVFIEKTKAELENNVSHTIYEKFGIKPDIVSIDFNTEIKDGITEISLNTVSVSFPSDTDEITLTAIKTYTEGIFGNETIVLCKRSK